MKYEILKTGSSGNCIILNNNIALDMGVPFKLIKDKYKDLKLVLISHIHSDHLNKTTIQKLIFEKPSICFGVGSFLVQDLVNLGVKPNKIFVLDSGKKYDLGSIIITPVELYHDVPNLAWKIIFKKDNYKVFFATDTGSLEGIEAKNYDLFLVEGNYKTEELQAKKEENILNRNFEIQSRVENTHLSYEQFVDFILQNASETSEVVQLHIHQDNVDNKK